MQHWYCEFEHCITKKVLHKWFRCFDAFDFENKLNGWKEKHPEYRMILHQVKSN